MNKYLLCFALGVFLTARIAFFRLAANDWDWKVAACSHGAAFFDIKDPNFRWHWIDEK